MIEPDDGPLTADEIEWLRFHDDEGHKFGVERLVDTVLELNRQAEIDYETSGDLVGLLQVKATEAEARATHMRHAAVRAFTRLYPDASVADTETFKALLGEEVRKALGNQP